MSALHKPTNLSRALANLGEGAEGATGDCPETWPDSSLLHLIQCRKIPLKVVSTPPVLPAKSTNLVVKEDSNPALISSPSQSTRSHRAGHLQGIFGKAEDCGWRGGVEHIASPHPYHVVAGTPDPSAELHGAWGPRCPHPDASQGPAPCCYPFPRG